MVALTSSNPTTLQTLNDLTILQKPRPYLGMSQLGHSCERYLWYSFRWCFNDIISNRIQRLFNRGHREEPAIVETLAKVGVRVYGDQTECVAIHGHCKGHCDGIAIGVLEAPMTEHLAEFKTMNDKAFKEVCKKGAKASKPVYYVQMQLYMYKLKLTRALFVAVNKNDDSMYIERIELDKDTAEYYFNRGESIILTDKPPERKENFKPTWFECKWCSAKDICHNKEKVNMNCRTCKYGDILPGGIWACSKYDMTLATEQQRQGCSKYEQLETLNV